jgi:uncharacterized protein YkwD
VAGLVAAAALLATALPAGATTAQHRATHAATTAPTKHKARNTKPAHLGPFSARLVEAMNAARKAQGLRPLRAVESIGRVAAAWSRRLSADDRLSHNPDLAAQVERSFPRWQRIDENVGAVENGSSQSATDGQQLANAYLASPVHRANILDPNVRWVGVANAVGDGVLWNTVDFVG